MQDKKSSGVYPLKGVVQDYAWGGIDYIPQLLGLSNDSNSPFAEYWVGVHPRGTSNILIGDAWLPLSTYSELPYLLKILDVNKMLSIQSHPNKVQALLGYAKENANEIPIGASNRIFKDENHKPELMVALSDFWLLHGFKSEKAIRQTLETTVGFDILKPHLEQGIAALYKHVMTMSEAEMISVLEPLRESLNQNPSTDKQLPDYWARLAFDEYGFDRGIFSIYFFNLVYLQMGEGIYQAAGIPHAYLEGKNIELMANSDNVFRAGLTPKHMDVEVLLAHLDFSEVSPQVIAPIVLNEFEQVYKSPAEEFELHFINMDRSDYQLDIKFDECFIVLAGSVELVTDKRIYSISQGECFFAHSGENLILKSIGISRIVRATQP